MSCRVNCENPTGTKPVVPSPVDRIKKLPVSKLEKLQEFMDKLEKE
jgi:hypothetical protein